MALAPWARKFALTAHVTASVGWLGSVTVMVGMSLVALTSHDEPTVRGVYLVMDPTARYVLLPLAITALLTGLVSALGSAWGLLRHYWVLAKLVVTMLAVLVLLAYLPTFDHLAELAADPATPVAQLSALASSPLLHAVLALAALLLANVLAVYKPRGLTRYGQRRRRDGRRPSRGA